MQPKSTLLQSLRAKLRLGHFSRRTEEAAVHWALASDSSPLARDRLPSEILRMISPAFDFEALRRLSVAERMQLVEDLWDSIAEDAPDEALPLTPELAAELEREIDEHERHPGSAVPWEQVRAELLDPARPRAR